MFRKSRLALAASTLCLFSAAGCTTYGPYPDQVSVTAVYIDHPPPVRPRVIIPPPPTRFAVWIDGYWNWTGVQFVWVDGFWDPDPPRAYHWVPDRWVQSDRGWHRQPGHWHPRERGRRK